MAGSLTPRTFRPDRQDVGFEARSLSRGGNTTADTATTRVTESVWLA